VRVAQRGLRGFLQPRAQLRFHAVLSFVFAAAFVPGLLYWRDSVPFLVAISIYANLAGHLAGMAAAAGARKADPGDDL
jgi:hypothetical protein